MRFNSWLGGLATRSVRAAGWMLLPLGVAESTVAADGGMHFKRGTVDPPDPVLPSLVNFQRVEMVSLE